MNAPKLVILTTLPVYLSPTSTSFVSPLIIFIAASAALASEDPMLIVPSSSISTVASVCSTIPRIVLPPGPITIPILSLGIVILFFFAYLIKSVLEFNFQILHGAITLIFGPK